MNIRPLARIISRQDGAVWNRYLFSCNEKGICHVFDLREIDSHSPDTRLQPICIFELDGLDVVKPHCNSVVFGNEYFSDEDEFPLMYASVYNNYAKVETDDKMKGVCCVYRIHRNGNDFSTTLVQIIRIGFTDDTELWLSQGEEPDKRPYGNFVIDREKSILYAFTMRDNCQTTRYFSFPLPKVAEGKISKQYKVNTFILEKDDILDYFDCEYHHFIQGACCHEGKIYSVEGFPRSVKNPPALRVINPAEKKQERYIPFGDYGLVLEAELIDFSEGVCLYSDGEGYLYTIEF